VQNPEQLVVRVRIQLTKDGRLAGTPSVVSRGNGPLYETSRDSALRALYRGQPYDMLSPANYEIWKDVEITFDPREMFRG
jgi:colicin import membrane protein